MDDEALKDKVPDTDVDGAAADDIKLTEANDGVMWLYCLVRARVCVHTCSIAACAN